MTINGTVLAPGGNTPATYTNINTDAGRLSNGGTVLSWLTQYGGDTASYDPWPAYDGVIQVLAPDNSVRKTISVKTDLGAGSRAVNDLSVEQLANGGFVVAWTDYSDESDYNAYQTHYAIYDNAGNKQSGGLLSSVHGHNVRIASLSDGGFATVFAAVNNNGEPNQQGVVNTFTYNAGTYTKQAESYVGDPNSLAPGASTAAEVGKLFMFDELSITGLKSGGFVVGAPTYDSYVDNGYTYTPLGDFIFNYSPTGQQEAFASGAYWQRVNWNPGQTNNAAVVTAYSGGFASLNRGDNGKWQVTLYHDDGTLVTTTTQTASVYHGGPTVSRTYYAVDLAPVVVPARGTDTSDPLNLDNFINLIDAGSKLIAVLPNAAGGFDFASISKSTGALLTLEDSGIAVPAGATLANLRLLPEGSDYDFTYDVLTDSGGYVLASTWQYGLDANTAPVVDHIAGDATSFVLGVPEYIDNGAYADVYDLDSASFDGGWLNVHQVSGNADGSFRFDLGVGTAQILWGGGAAVDTANDGANFTPAHAPAVGDKVWYSSSSSTDPANWILVGTIAADGQNGHDLKIAITDTEASIPNHSGGSDNYASLLLKYLMYTAPTLGARGFQVTVNDGDGATSTPVGFTMTGTSDTTSTIGGAAGVAEPVKLPASAASAAAAVAVFDFTVTDTGGDGLSTRIKTLALDAAGSGDFSKVTWLLTGPGIATSITGSYDATSHKLSFANTGIAVADGGSSVYTVKAYFADPAGAVAGKTFQLSIDGDSSVTLEQALSSQMAPAQAPVTNGSGSLVVAGPTVLAVEHAAPLGAGATNADTLSWTVRFSEAVQNLDASDFDVLGLAGETINVASAGANAYTITVSGGGLASLDGSVTLALAAGQDIANADGQQLQSLSPSGTDARSWLLDNTAPAAPSAPDLSAGSDSGSSPTDNRTNVDTPVFSGTAEAGATVTLYDENGHVLGSQVAIGGSWTIQSSQLAPGPHSISARAVDAAGNQSSASAPLPVFIDLAAAAPGLQLVADTGASGSDNLTRDGRIKVTLDADVASWQYSTDGGAGWTTGSGDSFTLGEGVYAAGKVQVRQTDTAGNTSPAQANAQPITVDTSVAAPAFALAHDTGSNPGDGITADGHVSVVLAGDAVSWEYSTDGGAGWTGGSGSGFLLAAGSYAAGKVQVRQLDAAGNQSAAAANTAPISVKAGVAAPSLLLASDTGSSPGDGITKLGTLNIGLAPDVASWAYRIGDGAWTPGSGSSIVLAPGNYEAGAIQVAQTDLAGNTSSVAVNTARILVDQSVDAPTLALAHDTGANGTDGITADGAVSVGLATDVASWQYSTNGGATWHAGSGSGFSLEAGSYAAGQVQVRQVDVAGNLSAAGGNTAAITVLAAPAAPSLALAHDTGTLATDGISSDGTVTVTLAAGATAWEYRTSVDGDWQAGSGTGFVLAEGSHAAGSVQVRQSDAAGNLSAVGSNLQPIVVDSAAPTVAGIVRAALAGPSGNAPFTVEVHYQDAASGLDPASIGVGDLTVTGPGSVGALHVSSAAWNAATGTATYTVDAPSGGWNGSHAGTYAIALAAGAVADLAGNGLAAPGSAQFQVSFNNAPQITSNGGGASAAIEIAEHRTAVTTVKATDPDAGDTLAYSITGGQDAALFAIDAASGALSLLKAPSAATPQDADGNNTYLVEIGASDGHGGIATQALTVTVLRDADGDGVPDIHDEDRDGDGRLDSAEDPVPSANGGTGDGNGDGIPDSQQVNVASLATVGSVLPSLRYATIEVAPGLTLTGVGNSAVTGLPRQAKMPLGQFDFTIGGLAVGASVEISVYVDKSLGANGYYKLDGTTWVNLGTASTVGSKTKISFTLTDGGKYDADGVANGVIVDPGGIAIIAPKIVSAGGMPTATVNVLENQVSVLTVAAEALGPVSYAITGGADAGKFSLDPVSGKLVFTSAPDYENPLDLGAGAHDNSYVVEVTATGAAGSDTQALTVVVQDVNEIPPLADDGDAVPAQMEQLAPGLAGRDGKPGAAGDGNGDGIADSRQANVASMPVTHGAASSWMTLVADSAGGKALGGATILAGVQQLDAAHGPAGLQQPLGQLGVTAAVAAHGAATSFSLYAERGIGVEGWYAQDKSGNWVDLADAPHGGKTVIEGGRVRLDFTVADGGQFDADGKADGVITLRGSPGRLALADTDQDQFPDALESANGLVVGVKDNDVFGSNKLFVMQLYRDLLSREAEHGGEAFWQGLLDGGKLDRAQVVSAFLDSAEFQAGAGAVARIYESALGRMPEHAGLVYWTQQVYAGESLGKVAEAIASGAEFTAVYGKLDGAAFLNQLYLNVFERPADQAGLAFWEGRMAAGMSRGDVVLGFAQSAEFKAASDHEITAVLGHLGLLGGDAAPEQTAYTAGELDAGQPEVKLIGGFLGMPEYHDRFLPHSAG